MTILGADNFANNGRVLTNGWNVSYDTQTWNILGGAASHFSVTAGAGGVGGKGQITGATGAQTAVLGSGTSADQDIRVRVSVTGATDNVSAFGRVQAANTGYRARLNSPNFQLISIVAGTITVLQSTPFTVSPNTNYQIHLRLRGTTISANVWADGTIEPSGFMLSVTDSSVTGAGQYGVTTALNATTDFAYYDQFVATNPTQVTDSPYGVTVPISNAKNPPAANYTNWPSLFADLFALGISWVRWQEDWKLIDTATTSAQNPATYSWAPLDEVVNRCNEAGLFILFVLRGEPSWALTNTAQRATNETGIDPSTGKPFSNSPNNDGWYLPDPTMMATFGGQVATRYNGNNGHGIIQAIEIGNELFNIHFVKPGFGFLGIYNSPYTEYNGLSGTNINVQPARDPHFFVPCLQAVSPALRAASPGVKVIFCALWWRQFPSCKDFMTDTYNELPSAKTYFDAGNFHFYSNTAAPDLAGSGTTYNPSFQQEWQTMQTAMTNAGDAGKAIYCTEFGWGTNTNNGSSIDCDINTQASRFSYVLNNAKGSGIVTKLFFFTLDYKTQDINANPITSTSSLVQWDVPSQTYIKLPAWTTWQNFVTANPTWTPPAVVTVPAVNRRSGGTLTAIARRSGGTLAAIARRDGTGMTAAKRRDGNVTAIKRRDGAVPATRRRG